MQRRVQAVPDAPPSGVQADEEAHDPWSAHLSAALLDENGPAPLYHQIHLVLRDLIRRLDLPPGTALPGEQALAKTFAVSRVTVKRALNELAAERLVSRHRGRGTLVAARKTIPVVRSSFDGLIESLQQMGLVTQVELLETGLVTASEARVAMQMRLDAGAVLQRAVRRRWLEEEPLSYLITYTPEHIAARYSKDDLAHTAFLLLLERAGSAPLEAEQWITAVAASPVIAAALKVRPSTPLLKIERIMRDGEGGVVQLVHGFYRPDLFQYHVHSLRSP